MNNNNKLLEWWNNKSKNPFTNRTIKENGKKWKFLLNESIKNNVMNDPYNEFHLYNLDPLTKMELNENIKYFEYNYCWCPLNGNILGIDKRGALKFDPDILIYYFYINRLKHLWVESTDGYSSTYGDGMGNGPDFHIKGRGPSYHWYLFRLPLSDAYCDKINQQTTLTPILNLKTIKKIYNIAKKNKNNYKELFGKDRPDLLKLYDLYHKSIQKPDYSLLKEFGTSKNEIKEGFTILNMTAINQLRKFQ
jgi:hypothetical protein